MSDHSAGSMIAVVDDDQRILGALEILLESADHAVCVFGSGAALLESGCLEHIDCLISDIGMPVLDGFELMRLVHEARPKLPVILITGQLDAQNRPSPFSTSDYRLFTKPFDGPELLAAVEDALAAAGRRH